jgi:hypothetical protein
LKTSYLNSKVGIIDIKVRIIKDDIPNDKIEEIPEIKKYFSRIFTVLSKEIRERVKNLDLPREKKKHLKRELAFLPREKQEQYLDEL